MTSAQLCEMVREARQRTLDLVADLTDEQLLAKPMAIVNPLLWEIGHVAWFQEKWTLRHLWALPPLRPEVDDLYDSMAVAHDKRWDLPLYGRAETIAYMEAVRDGILARLGCSPAARTSQPAPSIIAPPPGPSPFASTNHSENGEEVPYFIQLGVFHEDMHNEAFTYTRQTYGWPAPRFSGRARPAGRMEGRKDGGDASRISRDSEVPGGQFLLGAARDEPFVFDNEKWAHQVEVKPFRIATFATTQEEFRAFVEAAGYSEKSYWSEAGWAWRNREQAEHPMHWRKVPKGWERKVFDKWVALEPHRPVIHVNWFEADAFCRWAGRRLPMEAEWEMAASFDPSTGKKRRFPWGDEPPTHERANLDWARMDTADVYDCEAGDSPWRCRQMIGNVWEWTSTPFGPYPGFVTDPYEEYSEPWFGDHMVLRGGAWPTRSRLIRNTWRNFYRPDRRDTWCGFRTCAL